jgi:tripartite-type tricarboxylate transporter receptor subunit TctC
MSLSRRRFLHLAAGFAALPVVSSAACSSAAWAQAYPSRPIRLVVPFPPGGAFDTLGRPLAERLKQVLGTVIIENIGGGGSSLGASNVAHAAPDGYIVLLGGTLPHVNEALLKSKPLYDPLKDLDPIANVASNTIGIAVHPSVPAKTLAELIAYAKANPGKLSYGHVGIGSTNHLGGEMLKSLAGIDIVQVPYRGAGPATADLVAGQIPMGMIAVTGQGIELHRSGKIRILAVTSAKRLTAAPELPTATEAGVPGLIVVNDLGLLAPARTPKDVIDRLAQAVHAAMTDQAFVQVLISSGFEPDLDSTPDKFKRSLEDDIAHWTPIVQALALKID